MLLKKRWKYEKSFLYGIKRLTIQAKITELFYGTEYTREQINLAMQSSNPLEIVPSVDEGGHGTAMQVLQGTRNEAESFSGVAQNAEIVVVN